MADPALKDAFIACCNFGAGKDAKKSTATTSNVTKLFKDAKVFDKTVTSNSLDIAFAKVKTKGQKEINYEQFVKLLGELNFKDPEASKAKLAGTTVKAAGVTKTSKTGGVDKMTDASQYTGSHKERFDAETGKGKGIEGRVDRDAKAEAGYVGNYKGEGTYDKKK